MNERQRIARRESGRGHILRTLHYGRPVGATDEMILACCRQLWLTVGRDWVRRQLEYLAKRKLVTLAKPANPALPWRAELSRHGIDVYERVVECDPGIDLGPQFWSGDEAG